MRQVPAGTQAQQEIGTYKEDLQTLQKVPARYLQIYVAVLFVPFRHHWIRNRSALSLDNLIKNL